MVIPIVIVVASLFLDGLLTNYLPYSVGHLSIFTPLTTLVSIILIYAFFRHKDKEYFILVFITGIVYDLFYTNLLFLDGFLFLLIAFLFTKLYKNTGFNIFWIVLDIMLTIIVYESLFALLIVMFNLVPMSFDRLFYKISHSLLLNIIYGEILHLIIKIIPKKYKQVMIN